jgi:serine/threonine-protein kinase
VVANRYRIEGVLGEGGSGVVYLAEALMDRVGSGDAGTSIDSVAVAAHQRVALKVIHRHLLKDRQINRRFHREARILSRLRCPHLASLLDFGETEDGLLFMAQELVAGTSLEELLHGGPLSVERAVSIATQICAALDDAHAAGVVHRDLKPSNVIIESERDGDVRVRVLDFGMGKMIRGDPGESMNALTEQNMVFGTPEYMAPEQARGDQADERSDVYAVGVILYEMLTGGVPFQSNTPIGMMTAHLMEDPESPSSRAPHRGIAPALEAVVMHSLAKAPDQRYQNAAALAVALRRASCHPDDAAVAAPPEASEVLDLETRETENALSVTALRRTEPVGLPAASLSPETLPSAQAKTKPSRLWLVVGLAAALVGVAMGIIMSLLGAK